MEYAESKNLTDRQRLEVKQLVEEVHEFDGSKKAPYLSNQFNFYPQMPTFFSAKSAGKLVGFVMLYADGDTTESVDVFMIVAPQNRRQKMGTKLWQNAYRVLREFGYQKWEFIAEKSFLDSNPDFLTNLSLEADADPEYQMRLSKNEQEFMVTRADLEVRPLESKDIPTLVPIYTESFPESSANEAATYLTKGLADAANKNFVLVYDKKIVGCCSVDVSAEVEYYLYGVFVAKKYRNKGFARNLIVKVINWFPANDLQRRDCVLAVDGSNPIALHLYKSIGFKAETEVYYLYGKQ
ncbi:GNAT family N-acetyltransferase [Liquorilactobacillus mali]|uniref:GNAT family acetyltransferase n=1 Tax=Liquorilactobacillus mali KCTC 3596 = DSM 20444 TaxID=1046596 RepID=J0L0H2_9LACO|nr:GNAT family N-acetyltransferase [Liquorilactobacillus mali]EJF00795.1 GNAT family acetyltransferase [Liquorilactobacillus mali KCTC 3596 = DSM 20444]KRN09208.1 GNAT family acetyltransferase [Liquorilactobacillus mali KCTC 3596 = DSM 20444]QFQ74365.1 GNAT family N-acetyltransferase [Liquorilactobacillus mali]